MGSSSLQKASWNPSMIWQCSKRPPFQQVSTSWFTWTSFIWVSQSPPPPGFTRTLLELKVVRRGCSTTTLEMFSPRIMVSATNLLQFNCQHTTVWCRNKKWNLSAWREPHSVDGYQLNNRILLFFLKFMKLYYYVGSVFSFVLNHSRFLLQPLSCPPLAQQTDKHTIKQ